MVEIKCRVPSERVSVCTSVVESELSATRGVVESRELWVAKSALGAVYTAVPGSCRVGPHTDAQKRVESDQGGCRSGQFPESDDTFAGPHPVDQISYSLTSIHER